MMMRHVTAVALSVLIAACASTQAPVPGYVKVPGYPCGTQGLVCVGANDKPTGMCCDAGQACGGPFPNVGCPDTFCCDVGAGAVFGSRRMTKQRPSL